MSRARRKVPAEREESDEQLLAGLARRQHGVVARRRLLALGVSSSAIGRRVDTGRVARRCTPGSTPLDSRCSRETAGGSLRCSRAGPRAAIGYATAAFE